MKNTNTNTDIETTKTANAEPKKEKKHGKIKVLFAAFEAAPFVFTGGLGEVAGSLPVAINNSNYEVRVIMPKLKQIPDEFVEDMKYICNFYVSLGWRNEYCGLFSLKRKGVTFYFLDNEKYFHRNNVYGEFDDGERMAFYSKAVLESIMYMPNFAPDIIHANDWHASLIPVFLREHYQAIGEFRNMKTLFTIHNLKFQGKYSSSVIGDVCGLAGTPAYIQLISEKDTANYLQGGAIYSDWVSTVSPSYAEEICMSYYGEGLDWVFAKRKGNSLSGILNGISTTVYDPETDEALEVNFGVEDLHNKTKNKLELQAELGLEQNEDTPLFIVISRLTEQKGLDLLTYNLPHIAECNMQLAVLGVGDHKYEEAFGWYAHRYPQKIAFRKEFNGPLSHRMYAGADALLMPSRFEPCGLAQMIAMRYGTLPIVRETGGLKDSVTAYYIFDQVTDEFGNITRYDNADIADGFSFETFNADDLMNTIYHALHMWFNDRAIWNGMMKNAMKEDFSWKRSAKEYQELYSKLLGR